MGDKSSFLLTLCSLLMAALCMETSTIRQHVYLRTNKLTWSQARLYCQKFHIDLVSLETARTESKWLMDAGAEQVWIGEHKDSWNQSALENVRKWGSGEVAENDSTSESDESAPDDEECALFQIQTEQLRSRACNKKHSFVCLGDNLVLVKENKTWEDALQHCEDMETQCEKNRGESCRFPFSLLTLMQSDHDYVRDRIYSAETEEVWTGLRFLGGYWFWTDGQELEDKGALPRCPSQWKHCGTLSKYDTDNWITRDCSEKRNFICVKKRKFRENV